MSDPLDQLDHFTPPGPTVSRLTPAEVRRRGDRLRRRNNAFASVGAVAAVGLIATPLTLVGTGGDTPVDPAPIASEPAGGWVRTLPADFPLGAGMGVQGDPADVGTQQGEVVISSLVVCGQQVWSPEQPAATDVLGALWSDGVEGGEQRTIAVYTTAEVAQDALDDVQQAVEDCPDQSTGRGDHIQPIALDGSVGEESVAYMDQYLDSAGPTGEATAYVLNRVGNAVLLSKTFFGGGGDLTIAQDTVELLEDRAADTLDAMCAFAVEGCAAETGTG